MSGEEENNFVSLKKEDFGYGIVLPTPSTGAWQAPPSSGVEKNKRKRPYIRRLKKRVEVGSSFMCLICKKEYVYEAFLTRHIVSKHRACEPVHQYLCRQCGAIFADESGYEKHKAGFFEFLKHHLEHVAPKQREQENEVSQYEAFVNAGNFQLKEEDSARFQVEENADAMLDSILKELEETSTENVVLQQ